MDSPEVRDGDRAVVETTSPDTESHGYGTTVDRDTGGMGGPLTETRSRTSSGPKTETTVVPPPRDIPLEYLVSPVGRVVVVVGPGGARLTSESSVSLLSSSRPSYSGRLGVQCLVAHQEISVSRCLLTGRVVGVPLTNGQSRRDGTNVDPYGRTVRRPGYPRVRGVVVVPGVSPTQYWVLRGVGIPVTGRVLRGVGIPVDGIGDLLDGR